MNYIKHYLQLVQKYHAVSNHNEKHHIVPKSIFNREKIKNLLDPQCKIIEVNSSNNLKVLPIRAHYIAHMLLVKICQNIDIYAYQKMLFAANMMQSRYINSKNYEWIKYRYAKMLSETRTGLPSPAKGKKWNKEAKQKRSKLYKDISYIDRYGKYKARQLKEQRSLARLGKKHNENTINKLRYPKTEEHKIKIAKAHIGKKLDKQTKNKISNFMSNHDLNPSVDQTFYFFENIKTNQIIKARKIDMITNHGCTKAIYKVVNGKRKTDKGWKLWKSGVDLELENMK